MNGTTKLRAACNYVLIIVDKCGSTIKTIRERFTWRGHLPKNNYYNMGPKDVTWDNIEHKNCKAAVSTFPVEGREDTGIAMKANVLKGT